MILDEAAVEGAEAREVIADGVRVSLRQGEIVAAHPWSERLMGFRTLPARLGGGYAFWSASRTSVAEAFGADLRAVINVASRGGVRPWLDGVLLRSEAGTLELDPRTRAVRRFGFVAAGDAVAIDAKRAARVDTLGRATFTIDGGRTWVEVEATRGELVDSLRLLAGGVRLHTSSGASNELGLAGEHRVEPPAPRPHRNISAAPTIASPDHGLASARLAEAVLRGVRLDAKGDRILVGGDGRVAVVSLASGRVIDERQMPPPDRASSSKCQPMRLGEDLVVACEKAGHARVYLLRDDAFELVASFEVGGPFVSGGGGRFGRVGGCAPSRPVRTSEAPEQDEVPADHPAKELSNAARYCARFPGGAWIERRVQDATAEKIVRWTPGPDGSVTAIAPASLGKEALPSAGVRLLRVDGADDKLDLTPLRTREAGGLVDADAWQADDGSVHAWLAAPNGAFTNVRIDDRGALTKTPPPADVRKMGVRGPFALASIPATGEHAAKTLVSRDGGVSYREVEPPPGRLDELVADPTGCSDLGCVWESGLVRVGLDPVGAAVAARDGARRFVGDTASGTGLAPSFKRLQMTCRPVIEAAPRARAASGEARPRPRISVAAILPPHEKGVVDVAPPFDPEAAPRAVTIPSALHEGVMVAPILTSRGADLLLFGRDRVFPVSASSTTPWVLETEGRPNVAAEFGGALVLLDGDRGIVQIARPSGVAPVARLVRVLNVDRARLTLGRNRADGRLAIVGYSTSSGELWSGALDLGSGEVAPL